MLSGDTDRNGFRLVLLAHSATVNMADWHDIHRHLNVRCHCLPVGEQIYEPKALAQTH